MENGTVRLGRGLPGPKQAGAPWPVLSWLTDTQLTDCLCVSMGNGAVSVWRRPWGYPSVSWGGCVGVYGMCHHPRLMDRKYSQRNNNICRIYIQKNVRNQSTVLDWFQQNPQRKALILIDEPVYLKDDRSAADALTNLIHIPVLSEHTLTVCMHIA